MVTERHLEGLEFDIGELIAKNERARGSDFSRYARDPVGFIRDVLGGNPWARQVEIAEAARDRSQLTVRSCHAAGKDWLAARLALWWVYARRGLVVLTGPTGSQVEEILMRREVRAAFLAGGLPGELHIRALRPSGEGAAGILARTATGIHGLTGLHEARVLVIITEAQDPDIAHAWDAGFAVATGAEDRIVTLGNPTEPDGRFFCAHQPGSGWHAIRISADDIPNVREGRTVISGLLTREGVERFAREYGTDSAFYISRALGQFPAEATDSLITRLMWDAAVERWAAACEEGAREHVPMVMGVDPARLGPDKTAICVRQGPAVREFVIWHGLDTMATAERVQDEIVRIHTQGIGAVTDVHVDEVGLGAGVLDRLKQTLGSITWEEYLTHRTWPDIRTRHPRAHPFNAARQARIPDRFRNLRAQGYWTLRRELEEGRLALPDDAELREELLRTRVRFAANARIEIESKEGLKALLGRSPDRADALVISLAPMLPSGNRKVRIGR